MTNATALAERTLSANDDAQRMLLRAVLHDAAQWHYDTTTALACCREAGGTCAAHWDEHEPSLAAYRALTDELEAAEGMASGTGVQLTTGQLDVLAAALRPALAYRLASTSPASAALAAAYHQLAAPLGITRT